MGIKLVAAVACNSQRRGSYAARENGLNVADLVGLYLDVGSEDRSAP